MEWMGYRRIHIQTQFSRCGDVLVKKGGKNIGTGEGREGPRPIVNRSDAGRIFWSAMGEGGGRGGGGVKKGAELLPVVGASGEVVLFESHKREGRGGTAHSTRDFGFIAS